MSIPFSKRTADQKHDMAEKVFEDISRHHSECLVLYVDNSDENTSKIKCMISVKEDSVLRHVFSELAADIATYMQDG